MIADIMASQGAGGLPKKSLWIAPSRAPQQTVSLGNEEEGSAMDIEADGADEYRLFAEKMLAVPYHPIDHTTVVVEEEHSALLFPAAFPAMVSILDIPNAVLDVDPTSVDKLQDLKKKYYAELLTFMERDASTDMITLTDKFKQDLVELNQKAARLKVANFTMQHIEAHIKHLIIHKLKDHVPIESIRLMDRNWANYSLRWRDYLQFAEQTAARQDCASCKRIYTRNIASLLGSERSLCPACLIKVRVDTVIFKVKGKTPDEITPELLAPHLSMFKQ